MARQKPSSSAYWVTSSPSDPAFASPALPLHSIGLAADLIPNVNVLARARGRSAALGGSLTLLHGNVDYAY